jgi:hypothetical protein
MLLGRKRKGGRVTGPKLSRHSPALGGREDGMEWVDHEVAGQVVSSEAYAGSIRIAIYWVGEVDGWMMGSTDVTPPRGLASKKIDEAKCQAAAAVQVVLEKALADILTS